MAFTDLCHVMSINIWDPTSGHIQEMKFQFLSHRNAGKAIPLHSYLNINKTFFSFLINTFNV